MEPAKRLEDLVVWQLACQLRDLIQTQMIVKGPVRSDPELCGQIHDSSASVARNVAEGYGRYYPRENAYYVRIAKASLLETQNHLLDGQNRNFWTEALFRRAWRLSCRATKAIVPYLLYLESCDGKIPPPKPDERPET